MKIYTLLVIACLLFFVSCSSNTQTQTPPVQEIQNETNTPAVETITGSVEIVLVDKLDGILSEYCLDIAGGNKDVNPNNGLQVHTCYSYKGSLGTDQTFAADKLAENSLYMPDYDVCVSLSSLEAGTEVELSVCGENATELTFEENGGIRPIDAPTMCLTAAENSRMGKGSQHQIRDLSLEPCDDAKASYQTWKTRAL